MSAQQDMDAITKKILDTFTVPVEALGLTEQNSLATFQAGNLAHVPCGRTGERDMSDNERVRAIPLCSCNHIKRQHERELKCMAEGCDCPYFVYWGVWTGVVPQDGRDGYV